MGSVRGSGLVGIWVLVLLASGCGPDPVVSPQQRTPGDAGACAGGSAPDAPATRLYHASPDAPALDVYVNGSGTPLISQASFGSTSSFRAVPSGTHVVEIRPAFAPANSVPLYSDLSFGQVDRLQLPPAADPSFVTFDRVARGHPAGQAPRR